VWDESIKVVLGLFDSDAWRGKDVVYVKHCVDVTLPLALFIIGIAGFGRRVSWAEDEDVPLGHQIAFKDALHIVANNLVVRGFFPDWVLGLRKPWREARLAFRELRGYMHEMIVARRAAERKEERYDLFSGLLDASDDPSDKTRLNDDELIGNIFVFLLAGHETTAHTLAFTFGLLALYQDEQEKLYQHIMRVLPDGRVPEYDEMGKFTYSLAVFYETLRLYPPVVGVGKSCVEDTTVPVSGGVYGQSSILIPAGTGVSLSFVGLHYNPRYWPEPKEFRPERFMKNDWPRDAFLPFSSGARACIGRKFFETEGIAILTTLVSKYKIEVPEDDPAFVGLSLPEKREKLLEARPILTLAPKRLPLVFKRR